MDDYISKPTRGEELQDALERSAPPSDEQVGRSAREITAYLDQMRDQIDESFVKELILVFLEDTPRRLAAIRQAVTADDSQELNKAAHGLKGSSLNLGASAMGEICRELEAYRDRPTLDGAAALTAKLEREFEIVDEILRRRAES